MTSARTRIMLVVAVLVLAPCGGRFIAPPAHARTDIYLSFRADLAPYGEWSEYGDYGWVWRPRHVHHGWRPYVDGHWALTDAGWTWVADEPWGWAPYHYGRWFHDAGYGWAWVPGDEWAPAWVSWRHGGGVIGWAPLPPWATWSGGGIAADVYVEPAAFAFVAERDFIAPHLARFIVPTERNVTVINETRNITNYRLANDRVVNRSLDPREVERAVGRQIAPRRVETLRAAAPRAVGSARAQAAEHGRGRESRMEAQRGAPERHGRAPGRAVARPERHESGRGHAVARPDRLERRGAVTAGRGRHEYNRGATASAPMRHGAIGRDREARTGGRTGREREARTAGRPPATHGGRERMVREHGPGRIEQRRAARPPAAAERRHDAVQATGRPAAPRAERRVERGAGRVEYHVQGAAPAVAGRAHGAEGQASSGGRRPTNRRPANASAGRGQPREHP